jgi:hypothetical protein
MQAYVVREKASGLAILQCYIFTDTTEVFLVYSAKAGYSEDEKARRAYRSLLNNS